jgi:hypothetical protein
MYKYICYGWKGQKERGHYKNLELNGLLLEIAWFGTNGIDGE